MTCYNSLTSITIADQQVTMSAIAQTHVMQMSDIFTASDPSCSTFCSLTTWDEPPDEKAKQKVYCDTKNWWESCDDWCGCGIGRLMYMGKKSDGKL